MANQVVYQPVEQDGAWQLEHGEDEERVTVRATPLFESNVRIGFAEIRTIRANGSIVTQDRFNLARLAARRSYLRELKDHEIDLPEGVLIALSVVVSDAQHVFVRASSRKAFEHSNNQPEPPPQQTLEELAEAARELLECPDVLAKVGQTARARGYAGDTRGVRAIYAAIVSRSLARPINMAVVSDSAAGKNATVDAARELHPPEAVVEFRAGSARAVVYSDAEYEHKVVLFAEADSIPDDGPAASAVRSLAADNYLAYDVVEQDAETKKFATRHIQKAGPTGLLTTSTRSLRHQLNTRLLELGLADDAEQTRQVLHAHADRVRPADKPLPDLALWHAYGRYVARRAADLEGVHIPFAHALADLLPSKTLRMRRDYRQLLAMIEASALMHIRQRKVADGWLIAKRADYAAARELLESLFDTLASEGLTEAVRETVEAVGAGEEDVTQTVIAQRLELSRATVSWRVRRAIEGGWLVDDAPARSRSKRLRRGEPLPEDTSVLPTVERLFECSNAKRDEGIDTHHTSPPESRRSAREPLQAHVRERSNGRSQEHPAEGEQSSKPKKPRARVVFERPDQ